MNDKNYNSKFGIMGSKCSSPLVSRKAEDLFVKVNSLA